jgi:hypothetical protein
VVLKIFKLENSCNSNEKICSMMEFPSFGGVDKFSLKI